MEEPAKYGVSYIASATEELKVGDSVEIENSLSLKHGCIGSVIEVKDDNAVVVFGNHEIFGFKKSNLRKLPDPITFEEESDNVKDFNRVLKEMAETYKAKNEVYGNSYAEGFRRFGAVQLVSRIYEKYCRIENLLVHKADNKVPDESVLDTITDIAVQCVVLRNLLEVPDVEFEDVK